MAITNKGLVKLITGLLGAAALGGFVYTTVRSIKEKEVRQNQPYTQTAEDNSQNQKYIPTLADFKRALGKERLEGVADADLEELWRNTLSTENKNKIHMIYTSPEEYITGLSEEKKISYNAFDISNLNSEELTELRRYVPWELKEKTGRPAESDKLFIWFFLDNIPSVTPKFTGLY